MSKELDLTDGDMMTATHHIFTAGVRHSLLLGGFSPPRRLKGTFCPYLDKFWALEISHVRTL